MKEIRKIIEDYDFNKSFLKCSLVSVVNTDGSCYRRVGSRMLIYENGVCLGGISGGSLEGDALRKAQKAIYSDKPSIVRYDTRQDDSHLIGVGLGCHRIIDVLIVPVERNDPNNQIEILRKCLDKRFPQVLLTIIEHKSNQQLSGIIKRYTKQEDSSHLPKDQFFEIVKETFTLKSSQFFENEEVKISLQYLEPDIHLVMMGHQYDTLPMTKLANELGWQTTIFGSKQRMHRTSMLEADQIFDSKEAIPEIDTHTAVIIMSHDYKTDLENLKNIIDKDVPYIGLLGPRIRGIELIEDLGLEVSQMEDLNIYSPAGLDTGAISTEEISLSILAEIRTHLSHRQGGYYYKESIRQILER